MLTYFTTNNKQPEFLKVPYARTNTTIGGTVWTHQKNGAPISIPDKSKWEPLEEGVWAWPTADRLNPLDFLKSKQTGEPMKMGDGQDWILPKLRVAIYDAGQLIVESTAPTRVLLRGGKYLTQALPEWERVDNLADAILSGIQGQSEFTKIEILEIITDLLQVNYDICKYEVAYYGLFDDINAIAALQWCVDFQAILDIYETKIIAGDAVEIEQKKSSVEAAS